MNKKRYLLKNGLTLALKVTGVAHLEKEDLEEVLNVFYELEKLEKVIEILNKKMNIKFEDYQCEDMITNELKIEYYFKIDKLLYFTSKEEYNLLKEVLEDVKNR